MDLPPTDPNQPLRSKTPEQLAHDQAFARSQIDAVIRPRAKPDDSLPSWFAPAMILALILIVLGVVYTSLGHGIL
ncbi:MAG: hypothetical protein JWM74_1569 [Myxococcaceae bacterium]|jgi:hypothetical protein|nr:hypothetical protein [Myxococcaceae bacterium]